VPIISRNDCIYATLGICHSVWMTVWYAYQTVTQSAHSRPKHAEKRNKHTKKIVQQVGFIYKIIIIIIIIIIINYIWVNLMFF